VSTGRRPEDGAAGAATLTDDAEGVDGEEQGDAAGSEAGHRKDVERRVEDLTRRVKQMADESTLAVGKAARVADELETLKSQTNENIENMQVAFDDNAEILESIQKDVDELKGKLGEDTAEQLGKLKSELESRIAALERTRDAVSADVKILKSDGENIRKQLQASQGQAEHKLPELEQKLESGLAAAESKAEKIRQELKTLLDGVKSRADEAAEKGKSLPEAVKKTEELELKFLELDEERVAATRRSQEADQRIADLSRRFEELSGRIDNELDQAKGAYKDVEKALASASGAIQKTEEASRGVELLQEKLRGAEGEVAGLLDRLKESALQSEANRERVNLAFKLVEDIEDKIRRIIAPVDDVLGEIEEFEHVQTDGDLGFELNDLLQVMIKHNASDLHIKVGAPPTVRLDGELIPVGNQVLTENDCKRLVFNAITKSQRRRLLERKELDFAYAIPAARFRINVFLQRGSVSAAFRMLRTEMPTIEELGLPQSLKRLASYNNGLILVTGPAGAGKSTTLASIIDYINTNKKMHVITVEDPIEFVHKDKLSIITQREVGADTTSFGDALKQALRQDPNVILIGEMRDPETIMTAVIAAETGHLVLSTLHTPNTVQAIDRIIDSFTGDQQRQFRMLLANTLRGIVSQRLLSRSDEQGRVPAVEVLVSTPTIASLILEGKTNEIYPYMQQGASEGMQTFTQSLTRLFEQGMITKEEAMYHADQPTEFRLGVEGHSTGSSSYAEGDTLMNWL